MRAPTSAEWPEVLALVERAGLPTVDIGEASRPRFLVETDGGAVVGCVGVERHGAAGLLRSLAVAAPARGAGLGGRLVDAAVEAARAEGIAEVVLLTATAAPFFAARGWREVDRAAVPEAVRRSGQFAGGCAVCPASATCMTRRTDRDDSPPSSATPGARGGRAA